jgi:hypothetical protein
MKQEESETMASRPREKWLLLRIFMGFCGLRLDFLDLWLFEKAG